MKHWLKRLFAVKAGVDPGPMSVRRTTYTSSQHNTIGHVHSNRNRGFIGISLGAMMLWDLGSSSLVNAVSLPSKGHSGSVLSLGPNLLSISLHSQIILILGSWVHGSLSTPSLQPVS